MKYWKLIIVAVLVLGSSILVNAAPTDKDRQVIEVVTFKLKTGVTDAEFAPINKQVEVEHVSKQPGFISRESASGKERDWVVIVHWKSLKHAEASMASFEKASAAGNFMSKLEPGSMIMKRYQK